MFVMEKSSSSDITVTCDSFGEITNSKTKKVEKVLRYTLKSNDLVVQVVSYGATVTSIQTPDKNGKFEDVVLGYDNVRGYQNDTSTYLGATVGRCANRIRDGCFQLDGKSYQLAKNASGVSHLHGGNVGFNKVNWNSFVNKGKVVFTYHSEDGEEGYPGDLLVTVVYGITNGNRLEITFDAVSSKKTIINLTNHSYFNLAGQGSGAEGALNHIVSINADKITILDQTMVTTGELKHVGGTAYDLRIPKNLGQAIKGLKENGFDFNYCLNNSQATSNEVNENSVVFAARVVEPKCGRYLEVHTDQPGIQFYTGNFLPDGKGKNGTKFGKQSAFCLETQNYPNSINVDSFPSSVLRPGDRYKHRIFYTFGVVQN